MFDPINLDDMTTDPAELEQVSNVLCRLGCYAEYKAKAIRHRLAGDTEAAMSFEAAAQVQYQRLPQWAKW